MTRTEVLTALKAAFRGIGYENSLVKRNYYFADVSGEGVEVRQVPMAAFADYPHSYHNACVGVVFASDSEGAADFLAQHRSLGAPLILEVVGERIHPWSNRRDGMQSLGKSFLVSDMAKAIAKRRSEWGRESLGASRRPTGDQSSIQLELFDRGLIPMLQKEFQERLRQQLEYSYRVIEETYVRVHSREPDVASLFAFLFRFVTAKIFIDRADVTGWDQLGDDPLKILKAAEHHTGLLDKPESDFRRKAILEAAWGAVSTSLQFHNLAAPDLAFVAESAFITPDTRKQLGVHSTPSGLAEYIVENLPWEQVPRDKRVVFEPFSGHGILLAKAMERMGRDLPSTWTSARRHEYFRQRLIGVEDQTLSLEICRLVLTLTDYPNGNSWDGLHCSDVFQWGGWDETLEDATVILSNPPYESFSKPYRTEINAAKTKPPAEMMHRIMKSPPALLGLVLPRSFLTDPVYREANLEIARRYGEVKIVELPPIFRYADNDTIALMASSLRHGGAAVSLYHSQVPKGREEQFLEDFQVSENRQAVVPVPVEKGRMAFSLRLLPTDSIFADWNPVIKLGTVANIHKGVNWITRIDAKSQSAPRTDVAYEVEGKARKGYHEGAEKRRGNLTQFQLRKTRMLSLRDEDQDASTRAHLRPWEKPKVVCNAGALERDAPWRFCAFADARGLAFTKQFFAIWPHDDISIFALSAILSSPVANGFADWVEVSRRDNRIATLSEMPLPARCHLVEGGLIHQLAEKLQKLLEVRQEFFNQAHQPTEEEVIIAVLRLDAAVMDAYELTADQQQRLLKLFEGWNRPLPPPFNKKFSRYFPDGFEGEITLSQYLSDRDAANDPSWSESLLDERCALIEKEYREHLTKQEEARLEVLQDQLSAWAARHSTRDFARLERELAELRALPVDDEAVEQENKTSKH